MEDVGSSMWRWWKVELPPVDEPKGGILSKKSKHNEDQDDNDTKDSKKKRQKKQKDDATTTTTTTTTATATGTTEMLERQKAKAKQLLEKESQKKFSKASKKDERWLQTVLKSGTLSDRAAATTIMFQENPFDLKTFDGMLAMAKKKGRREAQMGFESLKELFINQLLPFGRPLRSFKEQPYHILEKATDQHLLFWMFEEEVKLRYAQFIGILEATTHDTVEHFREFSVKILADLLLARPHEQSSAILSILVNKLGDPDKKLASKVCYHLTCVIKRKEPLRMILAKEVEIYLARSNLTQHAQYYGTIVLNQMILKRGEVELPNKLINVYFALFKQLHSAGEIEGKILNSLLTGVNRAFPYASLSDEVYNEHFDILFKIVHVSTFNKAMQALLLLFQVLSHRKSVTSRFFRALYDKMLSKDLFQSSRQNLFFHVLFKSLKTDYSIPRIRAFIKRLLQISAYQTPAFACAALMLVSELLKRKPVLWTLITQAEDNSSSSSTESFQDKKAFNKPSMVDNDSEGDESSDDDRLDLPKETVRNMGYGKNKFDESDESDDDNSNQKKRNKVHLNTVSFDTGDNRSKPTSLTLSSNYDPRKRDPEFANADYSCLWELVMLEHHFHPSVRSFAKQLMEGTAIEYESDPLQDFSFSAFIDRFVFKNPKSSDKKRGGVSIMKPSNTSNGSVRSIPVSSSKFLEKGENEISEEDYFFYKYFKQKAALGLNRRKKKKAEKSKEKDKSKGEGEGEGNEGNDSEGDEESDFSDQEEYSYEDMVDEDDDDDLLGDEVDDDEDDFVNDLDDDGEEGSDEDESGGLLSSSSFASADEFAELLEESSTAGVPVKQLMWEKNKLKRKKSSTPSSSSLSSSKPKKASSGGEGQKQNDKKKRRHPGRDNKQRQPKQKNKKKNSKSRGGPPSKRQKRR